MTGCLKQRNLKLEFLKNKILWKKSAFWFIASFAVVSTALDQVRVIYSPTRSLPYQYFVEIKHAKPALGHYAYFTSSWYGGKVLKKIIGRGGDAIFYDSQGVLWVGKTKIGKIKSHARDARPLTPIKAGVIPENKVFVIGEHESSFDSRYEQMGLIPEATLSSRVLAIV